VKAPPSTESWSRLPLLPGVELHYRDEWQGPNEYQVRELRKQLEKMLSRRT
jgi:hypothetical protein